MTINSWHALSGVNGVTKEGKGMHLPPGAAYWWRRIEVRMLRNNYRISNASGWCPVAKSHQDQKCSQREHY